MAPKKTSAVAKDLPQADAAAQQPADASVSPATAARVARRVSSGEQKQKSAAGEKKAKSADKKKAVATPQAAVDDASPASSPSKRSSAEETTAASPSVAASSPDSETPAPSATPTPSGVDSGKKKKAATPVPSKIIKRLQEVLLNGESKKKYSQDELKQILDKFWKVAVEVLIEGEKKQRFDKKLGKKVDFTDHKVSLMNILTLKLSERDGQFFIPPLNSKATKALEVAEKPPRWHLTIVAKDGLKKDLAEHYERSHAQKLEEWRAGNSEARKAAEEKLEEVKRKAANKQQVAAGKEDAVVA
jgi:hypothetical protein